MIRGPGFATFMAVCFVWRAAAAPVEAALPQDPAVGVVDPEVALQPMEEQIAENNYEAAITSLSEFIKTNPQVARAHYDLGYALFRTHKIEASIRELSKALQMNPTNAAAHKILGLDCTIVGRFDLAEVELREAARLAPGSAEIHYSLARVYYMKAYNNLGLTMEALGDNTAALKYYTTAIKLNEEQNLKSEWPYVYLTSYYVRRQDYGNALLYAQKALEVNPKSDQAYFQVAKAYRNQREWQKAAEAAQKAIALNPRIAEFYYVLSLCLRKLGKPAESQAAMDQFEKVKRERESEEPAGRLLDQPPQEPLTAPPP
jgi:tetratricopeptide (TPR) repeat protein